VKPIFSNNNRVEDTNNFKFSRRFGRAFTTWIHASIEQMVKDIEQLDKEIEQLDKEIEQGKKEIEQLDKEIEQ